jgi:hypothetical protein
MNMPSPLFGMLRAMRGMRRPQGGGGGSNVSFGQSPGVDAMSGQLGGLQKIIKDDINRSFGTFSTLA